MTRATRVRAVLFVQDLTGNCVSGRLLRFREPCLPTGTRPQAHHAKTRLRAVLARSTDLTTEAHSSDASRKADDSIGRANGVALVSACLKDWSAHTTDMAESVVTAAMAFRACAVVAEATTPVVAARSLRATWSTARAVIETNLALSAIHGGAALSWRDAAVVRTAGPPLGTALAGDRAELPRIRATQLFAIAGSLATGVVAAFAVVSPDSIRIAAGGSAHARAVGALALPIHHDLVAGASDWPRGGGGAARRLGRVIEQGASSNGRAPHTKQAFEDRAPRSTPPKSPRQVVELPGIHVHSLLETRTCLSQTGHRPSGR